MIIPRLGTCDRKASGKLRIGASPIQSDISRSLKMQGHEQNNLQGSKFLHFDKARTGRKGQFVCVCVFEGAFFVCLKGNPKGKAPLWGSPDTPTHAWQCKEAKPHRLQFLLLGRMTQPVRTLTLGDCIAKGVLWKKTNGYE